MLFLVLLTCGLLLASRAGASSELDLTTLNLEDLMEIEVSLAVRAEERLIDTPAAAYVLTGEDIRRCGATGLPEALRLVPGVEVARIDANKWAVAARGFNGRFANKLLVLIDGRAVYTPFYSGVMWEMRDVMLEDVERIEVIRGRLRAAYSYLHMDLRAGPGANPVATYEEKASPEHQFFLWPSLELSDQLQLDATFRFVDRLPTYAIDRYAELDLRLGWQPARHLELTLAAQDLLHDSHAEFSDIYVNTVPTWTQRGFYGTIARTF